MRLEWTVKAIEDLRAAGVFIALDNPEAAQRMAERVREAAEYLIDHPNMGRPGRIVNTRELVVTGTPFIIVYWARGGAVQMLRLLHHSQKWP
jgi:addiction module RelE/StbE family toxin